MDGVRTQPHAQQRPTWAQRLDARRLAAELQRHVTGEVRFDDGSRALYATDGSNYRQVPIGVVIPRDEADVAATLAVCHRYGVPVLSRGGGTSLAGQCCNVAVVMDFSKYVNRILDLDPERRTARIQPGLVLDDLRDAAERHTLTFAPDPSTHNHCTLGGMIGNNSCGVHSVMGGETSANVHRLKVLTYDGVLLDVGPTSDDELARRIAAGGRAGAIFRGLRDLRDRYAPLIRERFPSIPRRVSGYNLPALLPEHGFDVAKALVGSEGTCVTIIEATVRLVYSPPARTLLVLGYPSIYEAGDHVPEILQAHPIGLEGIDDRLVDDMKKKGLHPTYLKLLPDGAGFLLVEFGGETKAESDAKANELMATLRRQGQAPSMKLYDDADEERLIWKIRESGLGATARVPGEPDTWEGWEDSAVPPERVGGYLRALRSLFDKFGYNCALYGHLGQGCVHTRIDFDLASAPGIANYRAFMDEATSLVVSFGGSLSGEHGDGQSRAEFLGKMFGPELIQAFREFKAIWDPQGHMNPGKVVDPYRIDQNLRLGAHYDQPDVATHFHFPGDDRGSFPRAVLRCVGVGECRRHDGGTMCPSYQVTREEKHSTRGRARLLWEMLQGEVLTKGWQEEAVKEGLDLCLSCKGCKSDCPVNVDMATYKAEFLSHYYQGHRRPRTAYSFGWIQYWARLAQQVPSLANFVTQTPGLRRIAKWAAGMTPGRRIPPFAPETFRQWFRRRPVANVGHPPVILWPDTFNDHFHPETAKAAVEVLEAAGFQVTVPDTWLCCGRPLYDYGFLDQAKALLQRTLRTLKAEIEAGVPIVGLEPSCVSVFRDEMPNLFPNDEDARRLRDQVYLLSEFLETHAPTFTVPSLDLPAIVQDHCHHKSVLGTTPEHRWFQRLGLDVSIPESSCCGMAGAFGFEPGSHAEVADALANRHLVPAVREAPASTLVVADGFSCRQTLWQHTDRRGLHLAEVLALALRRIPLRGETPVETAILPDPGEIRRSARKGALIVAGSLLAAGALVVAWRRSRST